MCSFYLGKWTNLTSFQMGWNHPTGFKDFDKPWSDPLKPNHLRTTMTYSSSWHIPQSTYPPWSNEMTWKGRKKWSCLIRLFFFRDVDRGLLYIFPFENLVWSYCWWIRVLANQSRLVVYPINYSVLYIPGGCFGISEPSTVWASTQLARTISGM